MLPPFVREYALTALAGAPDVLERLLAGVAPADPVWDRRPDPARFTLREVVGHLADWNGVFLGRIARTRDEDRPGLTFRTPEDVARESGSFGAAPADSLARFRAGRAEMALILRALEPPQWERVGTLPGHPQVTGDISIEAWIMQIVGHDGYHLRQVAEWLRPDRQNDVDRKSAEVNSASSSDAVLGGIRETSMSYHVYENWRAQGHYAKVHLSHCGQCKNGQGTHPGAGNSNGKWHGPFVSLNEATVAAHKASRIVSNCQHCLKG